MSPKAYATALWQALSEVTAESQDQVIEKFINVLRTEGKLELLPEIYQELEVQEQNFAAKPSAELTVAHTELATPELLDAAHKAIGADTLLKTKIDESIIGGILLKTEDLLIDASVKGSLEQLKDRLTD